MFKWLKNIYFANKQKLVILGLALVNRKTPRNIRILIIIALVYLISPIDIIPDSIPGLGLVDDVIIVPGILYAVKNMLPGNLYQELEYKSHRFEKWLPWILAGVGLTFIAWIVLVLIFIYRLIFN